MNGKQLKNSILQWAIQGKLVPQDPNDEPASVLLEKIRTEKARLIKEGKIKKDKNESFIFRGDDNSYYEKFLATGEVKCIDDEIPFEIPQGWEWCRLSLLIYPPKYGTSKKSVPSGLLPVLRMGNIQDGEIVFDKLVYSNDLDDNKKLLLQYGDLLFNRTNSAELVGKTAIFRGQRNAIFAGYLILLRPIFINSEYLNLLLNAPYARDYCNEVKTIGVQQCNINAEKISNLLIPVPNLHETVAIVEKVKNIALPIIKYGEFYQKLKHLNRELPIIIRKSILQEAIQGKLVPQIAEEGTARELLEQIKTEKEKLVREGKLKKSALTDSVIFRGDDNKYYEQIGKDVVDITEDIPFEIPDSWEWMRGRMIFLPMESIKPQGANFVYIDVDAVNNKRNVIDKAKTLPISQAPSRATRKLHIGDVLFSMVRPYLRNIALVDEKYSDAIASTGFYVLTPTCALYSPYLFYLMLSSYVVDGLNQFMKGDNSPSINNGHIENYIYPLPPLNEQKRIVHKIEELYAHL